MQRRCFLLAGLVLLPTLGANAQQPTRSDSAVIYTRADSAAFFTLAVERILAADSAHNMRLGANAPLRIIRVPQEAWAAPAVERLRTMERPGEDGEKVSISAPEFSGKMASLTENRVHCSPYGPNYSNHYTYTFMRADTGWQYLIELKGSGCIVCFWERVDSKR